MAADLKARYGVDSTLVPSGGGVFEVKVGEELVFSKKKLGRFPEHQEVFEEIDQLT